MKSITPIALFTLFLTGAQAATITHTSSPLNLNVSAGAANVPPLTLLGTFQDTETNSVNFTLPQFDSGLGTLQSVQFSISLPTGQTAATFDVAGLSILSAVTLDRSVALNITSGAFTNPLGTGTANVTGTPLATALGITLGLGFSADSNLASPASTAVQSFTTSSFSGASQLSAVTGGSTLAMSLSATDFYQFTTTAALGAASWGGTTSYAGNVSVTYTYAPVPEPSSFGLLIAGGLVGVLLIRRNLHGHQSV